MIIEYYDTYEYRELLLFLMDSDSKLQFLAAATFLGVHSLIVTLYMFICIDILLGFLKFLSLHNYLNPHRIHNQVLFLQDKEHCLAATVLKFKYISKVPAIR